MRKYVLIKEYNPAYDSWLRVYLKQKNIMGEREYSWKEAQDIIIDMAARGIRDEFFERYFSYWRSHPEYPPAYLDLLGLVLPVYNNGKIDLDKLAQLDGRARERHHRILFAAEDSAEDFSGYYRRLLRKPLKQALESGTKGQALADYFEFEELDRRPDVRVVGLAKVEEADHEIAVELLSWLQKITPDKILRDITTTLDQHYDRGVKEAKPERSYIQTSEFVRLMIEKSSVQDDAATVILCPARGHRVIREGYEGVFYPTYYVQVQP